MDQFLHADPALPKALLFTEKPNTSSLYKSLSLRFGFQMVNPSYPVYPPSPSPWEASAENRRKTEI